MLSLVLALAVTQAPNASNSRVTRVERVPGQRAPGGRRGGRGYAFFEFAPTGGAGMGAPCACTTPSGAKGETLTFTRASNGTCTKTAAGGLATTGIANGDLVVCSTNQPRVEYDAQGVLGLLVESSRTNLALRSQEIDNAAYTKAGTLIAAPTVTADFAVAPDGTTTAERVTWPACTTANSSSLVFQGISTSAASYSETLYVKSNTGLAQNLSLCQWSSVKSCQTCAVAATGWTRCKFENYTAAVGTENVYFGCNNDSTFSGFSDTGAGDLLVWGMQFEQGAYVTSYIPTVAATVTRSAETPLVTNSSTITAGNYSMAVTINSPAGSGTFVPLTAYTDASNYVALYQTGTTWNSDIKQAAAGPVGTNASSGMTSVRLVGLNDGTNQTGLLNGVAFSTPAAGTKTVSVTTIGLGVNVGGVNQIDGIVSRTCYQPIDPGGVRCR